MKTLQLQPYNIVVNMGLQDTSEGSITINGLGKKKNIHNIAHKLICIFTEIDVCFFLCELPN